MTEETLQKFQCVSSKRKHFLIDPIKLTNCGHSVCKSCLQDGCTTTIKCSICEIITELDSSKVQIAEDLKQALENNLYSIIKMIEKETALKLNELESKKIHSN